MAATPMTYMKEDDYIPKSLLTASLTNLSQSLPFMSHGLGQFRPYRPIQSFVVCNPEHMPTRQSTNAAGFDLVAAEEVIVPPRNTSVVDTGVSIALPKGHYGRVAGRSSLAFKHGVTAFEGTIDEDYRGPVKVKLFNHSDTQYEAPPLTRIAQMIIQPYVVPHMLSVCSLPETDRGSGGFGSTGTI